MLKRYRGRQIKMTVCIGLLCDDKKAAVAVADRMITDDYLSVGFEHGECKIIKLSKNCLAMCAGYTPIISEILAPIIEGHIDESVPVLKLASKVAESYSKVRKEKINGLYFKPRGLDINTYHSSRVNVNLLRELDTVVEDFEFPEMDSDAGLEILVLGVDNGKGHIYYIDNPGTFSCRDSVGWMCIGSGYPPAETSLILNKFSSKVSLKEALYYGFEAKRVAEKSPEVGAEFTDVAKINNLVSFLSPKELSTLGQVYEKKKSLLRPVNNKINTLIKEAEL